MSVIKVMDELLANKIAAGEVVEKVSSVVKELVENSCDAKSTYITINLIEGGLKSITVIDDGIGMDKEDAILSFSRHATSKIYKDDDLFFIDTLGFRGEALPSIASVSEVELKTCKSDSGTLVRIKGGKILDVGISPGRVGTTIKVSNLFYNTPARLKYLKSEQSELSMVVDLVEKISLAYSNISFTLTNNDKVLLKTTGSNNLLKVIHEIYGSEISSNMLEINTMDDDYVVRGYVCKPEILRSTRKEMITIVNGRVVKNNEILKSINDAYYTYKPDGKYPVVVLFIDVDPTLVDVNIHPTKQDIKISKLNELYNLLYSSIKDVLYNSLLIPNISIIKKEELPFETESIIDKPILKSDNLEDNNSFTEQITLDFKDKENPYKKELFKDLVLYPVGLCLGTYIVCENDEGVYLLDQHAAQERVNYELYLDNLKKEKTSTINMLIPLNIEFKTSDYLKFNNNKNIFLNMGFTYEDFGVNTIKVTSHPTWLRRGYETEQTKKIIDLIIVNEDKFDEIKFRENVAITLACKMAIKANEHISMLEIQGLLDNLLKCEQPYNCPHGRPTIIKFSIYDLEKMFKRAMD